MRTVFAGIFRRLFSNPMSALRDATQLANAGRFADAEEVLTTALDKMPPAAQCKGKAAEQRFLLLALLSDMIRKGTGDAEKELEILNECATLAEKVPPPPPGPDHLVNMVYLINMNRGNAAGRTGRHDLAEQAYAAALEAARDPEIHCKCLAYQGWAIIRQRDKTKLAQAWACFDRFDRICVTFSKFLEATGKTISPLLVLHVLPGRMVQCLYQDDLNGARRVCEQSIQIDPSPGLAHQLLEILRPPGATVAEGIRFVLEGHADEQPARPKASRFLLCRKTSERFAAL